MPTSAHILSRYQMPTTQLERGWMNTNALSVIDVAAKKLLNTVLLDDIDLGAAKPWGVATTADGKRIIVSHAGDARIERDRRGGLIAKLTGMPKTIEEAKAAGRYDTQGSYSSVTVEDVPNDLAFLVDLRRRIQLRRGGPWGLVKDEGPLVNGPRGLDVIGTKVYMAVYFSDLMAVVDLEDKSYYPVKVIRVGSRTAVHRPASRRDVLPRRRSVLPALAELCQLPPGRSRRRFELGPVERRAGHPKNNKSMLLSTGPRRR